MKKCGSRRRRYISDGKLFIVQRGCVAGRCNEVTIIVHAGDEDPERTSREAPTLRNTTKSVREGKRRQYKTDGRRR